jgi:hypothetical protein
MRKLALPDRIDHLELANRDIGGNAKRLAEQQPGVFDGAGLAAFGEQQVDVVRDPAGDLAAREQLGDGRGLEVPAHAAAARGADVGVEADGERQGVVKAQQRIAVRVGADRVLLRHHIAHGREAHAVRIETGNGIVAHRAGHAILAGERGNGVGRGGDNGAKQRSEGQAFHRSYLGTGCGVRGCTKQSCGAGHRSAN